MDPKISDYIKANRERYTREAIRDQLVAAGHEPSAIDQALDEARPEPQRPQSEAGGAGEQVQSGPVEQRGNPRLVAYVLAAFVLGLIVLLWTGYWRSLPEWLVAYVVIGGIGALLLMRLRVSGWKWALVVPLVPIFFALVWYGTCYATFAIYCESIFSGGC